jgi:ADP-heptose:LPS heptosyltransferase
MTFHIRAFWRRNNRIAPPYGRVLIAKTTQLGDLVICLPMASALKKRDPHCQVILLTNPATVEVARCCPDVDEAHGEPPTKSALLAFLKALRIDTFIQLSPSRVLAEAARDAGIPNRIGSLYRAYSWRFCTHLVAVSGSLSGLNKRLLDLQHLAPAGIRVDDLESVRHLYRLHRPPSLPAALALHPAHFSHGRKRIIISPTLITAKSHQWPLEFYSRLIHALDPSRFHWFICGVAADRKSLLPLLGKHRLESNVTDLVGSMTLSQFTAFISDCDGLIAGSTGPLHLAAALGIRTLGLFQSRRIDLQRWHPVGGRSTVLHSAVRCGGEPRRTGSAPVEPCPCILAIAPERVARHVAGWFDT